MERVILTDEVIKEAHKHFIEDYEDYDHDKVSEELQKIKEEEIKREEDDDYKEEITEFEDEEETMKGGASKHINFIQLALSGIIILSTSIQAVYL